MRSRPVVAYPVIFKYLNCESGPFISVRSPNLPGLVVGADDPQTALRDTQNGIAQLLSCPPYPPVKDPTGWVLAPNEEIVFVSVDLARWQPGMMDEPVNE